MYTIFRNGGWPMFFIFAFGLVSLATAGAFALRPSAVHEGFIKWMMRATLLSILAGTFADAGTVMYVVCKIVDAEERSRTMLEGFAESTSPGVMGFPLLSLAALLAAVGRRRLDARRA